MIKNFLAVFAVCFVQQVHAVDTAQVSAFSHTLAPGKVAEECLKMEAGSAIKYSFNAAAPLAFNIYFHRGEDVTYPVQIKSVQSRTSRFVAAEAQEYCWMWTNRGKRPVTLNGALDPKQERLAP
jgi:hypothetical protein